MIVPHFYIQIVIYTPNRIVFLNVKMPSLFVFGGEDTFRFANLVNCGPGLAFSGESGI
jgi:hypothetical protein